MYIFCEAFSNANAPVSNITAARTRLSALGEVNPAAAGQPKVLNNYVMHY